MNLEMLGNLNRIIVFILFVMLFVNICALNFNASVNRYLNNDKQTIFDIVYKVPNNQLSFQKTNNTFIAPINVTLNLKKDGIIVLTRNFDQTAGAKSEAISASSNYYTIDKVSLTLAKAGFLAELIVKDVNSADSSVQSFHLDLLDPNALLSDIEISHNIVENQSNQLAKFHRGDYLFFVDPIPVFYSSNDTVFVYYEIYNLNKMSSDKYNYIQNIKIYNENSVITDITENLSLDELPSKIIKKIPLDLQIDGYFNIDITLTDLSNSNKYTSKNNISILKEYIKVTRIFDTDEEEFILMSYFLNTTEKKQWRKLNDTGKKNLIDRFWSQNDPTPNDNNNEFLDLIKTRINYSNKQFSHFEKGWKTDQGKLYIKYGQPDEIVSGITQANAKYSRKDYKVWKYNGKDRLYLLLDFQNSGNYKIIMAKNDDNEKTDPSWVSYIINTQFADIGETGWISDIDDDLKKLIENE